MYQPRVLGIDPYISKIIGDAADIVEDHPVTEFLETRIERKIKSSAAVVVLSYVAQNPYVQKFVRFGAKGSIRLVPYVGWVMLAYDLYELGDDLELY